MLTLCFVGPHTRRRRPSHAQGDDGPLGRKGVPPAPPWVPLLLLPLLLLILLLHYYAVVCGVVWCAEACVLYSLLSGVRLVLSTPSCTLVCAQVALARTPLTRCACAVCAPCVRAAHVLCCACYACAVCARAVCTRRTGSAIRCSCTPLSPHDVPLFDPTSLLFSSCTSQMHSSIKTS